MVMLIKIENTLRGCLNRIHFTNIFHQISHTKKFQIDIFELKNQLVKLQFNTSAVVRVL